MDKQDLFCALRHLLPGSGFRVPGLGFGVWGLGFEFWDLWFRVWGLGFGVWGLGFGIWDLRFVIWGLGFRGLDLEFRVHGLGFSQRKPSKSTNHGPIQGGGGGETHGSPNATVQHRTTCSVPRGVDADA